MPLDDTTSQASGLRLDDIDLLDRDVFAERVPHDWFALPPGRGADLPPSRAGWPRLLGLHRPRGRGRAQPRLGQLLVRAVARRRDPARGAVAGDAGPDGGGRRRRAAHVDDGPARPHPAPQARQPGLHAEGHPLDRGPPARAQRAHRRAGDGRRRRVRLRGRRRRRAAARGHRRVPRRAERGPAQDLRLVQPDDRQRGPRVHGHGRGPARRPDPDVRLRPRARRAAARAARATTS